jgi:hypothetical protein
MAIRGRIFRAPDGDNWSVDVEAHPSEPGYWRWVIRLNGKRLSSGGRFRTASRAKVVGPGGMRVKQALHYGR